MPNQFSHPWNLQDLEYLKRNYLFHSYNDIGRELGRTYSSIQSMLRNLNIHKRIDKYPINSNFFKKWSQEMAYTLGFVTADGNVQQTKKGYHVDIACDDIDVIQKIKAVMEAETPIREKKRFNGKISYSLRFSDKVMFSDLVKLGIKPRKSLVVKPPKIPNKYYWHYIRGFLDGDGCVYRDCTPYHYLHVLFYTGSTLMAQFLLNTINTYLIDYKGKIRKISGKNAFVVHFGYKQAKIISRYLYKDASIFMRRKYEIATT